MAPPAPAGLRLINSLTRLSRIIAWAAPSGIQLQGFNIYRGKTDIFSDSVIINQAPVTIEFFEDFIKERVEGFTFYYWVTSIGLGPYNFPGYGSGPYNVGTNNESQPAGPVWQEFTPFHPTPLKSSVFSIRRAADEIRRRHGKILKFDGEVAHYLARKVAGQLAQDYDPLRRDAPYRSNPSVAGDPNLGAFGTRFQGGYVTVANMLIRFIPVTQRLTREELGLTATRNPTCWVVDFPIMQPRDVIVRANNERYRITTVRPQSIGGRVTRQVAELECLEEADIIYSFPVPRFIDPNAPVDPVPQYPIINLPAKLPDQSSN